MPSGKLTLFVLVSFILAASPAHAYIGPGTGVGTIAIVLGVLASVILAFFAIIWYPLKRMVSNIRSMGQAAAEQDNTETSTNSGES